MAGIDVGSSASRRDLNRELPLVPFIDFLLCLVAFLLVTAVWSQMARLDANAKVPGPVSGPAPERTLELHVDARESQRISLEWRDGSTVVDRQELPREPAPSGAAPRYPLLARAVERLWAERGVHRAPSDEVRDRAVVHSSNAAPFEEVVAVMDAIQGVQRPFFRGAGAVRAPAFDVVFAMD